VDVDARAPIVSGSATGRGGIGREAAAGGGWIVGPLFDVLFFINVYWVIAFLPLYTSPSGEPYIQFWMAYFLATPHRWLTLVVAATDRDRRYGQTWLFLVIAVFCAGLIGATLWATGDFRALFLFYTLLLGWHFAGQHSIMLRIYAGKSPRAERPGEDWLPMVFILYCNVRLVSFLEPMFQLGRLSGLGALDLAMLSIPAYLLAVELIGFSRQRLPKLLYLISCFGLWSSVLWAAHLHRSTLCSVLLGAVTVFHSVEYLAMVTYYAWRRSEIGTAGLFQVMARRWTVVFAWYVIGCGLLYSFGNAYFVVACYAVNTWASLLHCAYDGLMWRMRDPETTRVFGLEVMPEGQV